MNKIEKDLDELVAEGLLGEDAAQNIRNYYANRRGVSNSSLVGIFTAIGSLLVGLGIILLVAHNWDELNHGLKLFFAFLPLGLSQLFCFYTLWKSKESKVLRESSGTLLVLSIASCISLISQIYHIDGDIGDFLMVWILLSLIVVYIMQSSISWIIMLIASVGYLFAGGSHVELISAAFVLSLAPYYFFLYRANPQNNFLRFFDWLYPLALISTSVALCDDGENYTLLVILALCSLFYLFGKKYLYPLRDSLNGYMVIGVMGVIICMIILSFESSWKFVINHLDRGDATIPLIMLGIYPVLSIFIFYNLISNRKEKLEENIEVFEWTFIIAPLFLLLSSGAETFAVVIDNILVFVLGIFNIRRGLKIGHLGVLNLGFSILGLFVLIRFFDDSWSFLIRGALFVMVGIGMFVANSVILKKRKAMEVQNEK